MRFLTTGQLARQAHVKTETVRYYERRGLIPQPERLPSGYRQYPVDTVARIQFIKHAKQLGFTLTEIQELLSLRLEPTSSCAEVKRRAEAKVEHISEKIQILKKMKDALMELARSCDGRGPVSDCSILKALEQ